LIGIEQIAPGECGSGIIEVMSPAYWQRLKVGDQIEMGEGSHCIAVATIRAIRWTNEGVKGCDEEAGS
jgi:hypothetical protein